MDKKTIDRYVKEIAGKQKETMQELTCREVLDVCRPAITLICGGEIKAEWLNFVCDYCKNMYYPDNFPSYWPAKWNEAAEGYLTILDLALENERKIIPFNPRMHFDLPTEEELEGCEIRKEYDRYLAACRRVHVFAFLRLSRECTPFDTLGHITGVHHISMTMARQLHAHGERVDLGLMSAAAILHDIGKFGCRPQESRRVPYLHYYYSAQFANRYSLPVIGHIAANHSVWDLELDNISLENLLLIYADFRAKSIRVEGKEHSVFWSLANAYDVILSKLDNVDDQKRLRYHRAYSRLKDFEDYMCRRGVQVDMDDEGMVCPAEDTDFYRSPRFLEKDYVVFHPQEQTTKIKDMAISSNLQVMDILSHEVRFVDLLEDMRGEKDWQNVRSYLNVISEYSRYVTKKQKDMLLDAMYEIMMNPDGTLRRQAAGIAGRIIANYEIVYRKEVPEGYSVLIHGKRADKVWEELLHRILIPDHMVTSRQRRWMGYSLKTVWENMILNCQPSAREAFIKVLLRYYTMRERDELLTFLLADCVINIDYSMCSSKQQAVLLDYQIKCIRGANLETRIAAWRSIAHWLQEGWQPVASAKSALLKLIDERGNYLQGDWLENPDPNEIQNEMPLAERYLMIVSKAKLMPQAEGDDPVRDYIIQIPYQRWSAMYWENQRRDTPWVLKIVHLNMLEIHHRRNGDRNLFQYASHLSNLLQITEQIVVRRFAGRMLCTIFPRLSIAERFEIVQELLQGLEVGSYSAGRYIPEPLGKIFVLLSSENRHEVITRFRTMLDGKRTHSAMLTLETIGTALSCTMSLQDQEDGERDIHYLIGLLLRGLAHYQSEVAEEAFFQIGHALFGSDKISPEAKGTLFEIMGRRLMAFDIRTKSERYRYNHASSLNCLYRFLSAYIFKYGQAPDWKERDAAFFPGTFDPFSMGHKEIMKALAARGMEVYLALDEFSWSKQTQGSEIRRKIMEMSSADYPEAQLFADDIPINIANPEDIRRLKEIFRGRKLYLAVGADVPLNASAYRLEPGENTVHSLNHILFCRAGSPLPETDKLGITGEIQLLKLSEEFNEISSTRIRENLDQNRDITRLVAANARSYIYDRNLYIREPVFKRVIKSRPIVTEYSEAMIGECRQFCIRIRREKPDNQMIGRTFFRRLTISNMGNLGERDACTRWMRQNLAGKVMDLTELTADSEDDLQSVLTENFAHCLQREVTWMTCLHPGKNREILQRQGFIPIPESIEGMYMDLRNPAVLFADSEMGLKEPFSLDENFQKFRHLSIIRLQEALCRLYPGSLILLLDSNVINYRLMKKITTANHVPEEPTNPRKLGEKMCVPFGSMLIGNLVPNTVTKSLNTEKVFSADLTSSAIREFPGYASLENQVRTIHSFNRPVILVEDVLDKGYRMRAIQPYIEKEKIEVSELIVGIMSANGKDIADRAGRKSDAVYFIPNIRAWMNVKDFYPFFGGETVEVHNQFERSLSALPSVNPILPYQIPKYLGNTSQEAFFELSRTALGSAKEMWEAVEESYRKTFGRRLTIMRLAEVLSQPRIPEQGNSTGLHEDAVPSACIEYEMECLKRLEGIKSQW